RHTRFSRDWSSDVCSSDLLAVLLVSVLVWVIMMPRGEQIPTSSRTVPDLSNVSYERAQSDLEELDLRSRIIYEANATVTEDNVRSEERRVGKESGSKRGGR